VIINTHIHMARYGKDFSEELGEFYTQMFAGHPCWYTGEPWKPSDFCVPLSRLMYDMDRLGIDKCVVLGWALMPMNSYDPFAADYVHEMVSQYPDRLIGFYTANPTGGVAEVRRIEHAVKDLGLRGVKMLPSYNFIKLNDRRIWPIYEIAEELQLPVVIHTGWSSLPKGKMLEFDHPLFLEDVALDFPNLKIIAAHTGFQWVEETMFWMAKTPNIYSDFAYWAETTPVWRIAQVFSFAKMLGVMDRFLWGSDYPFVDFATGLEVFERAKAYSERHELEPLVTNDDVAGFFGNNAARLFGFEVKGVEAVGANRVTTHC
jgi:predicted TIM-barrel fold metal-dependent hydrolase